MNHTDSLSQAVSIRLHFVGQARRWLNVLICASLSMLTCVLPNTAFAADWWNASWSKCREITIANTGTTTLSNFPAYISLAYDTDMQSDYDDIRFIDTTCDNNGSELDFEIESYSVTSADVWVEIDSLPAAGKTIAVYYGNASAGSGEDVNGAWDSNHQGVWHLGENTNATNLDSTSNSNNGSPDKSPASDTGKIGRALNFGSADRTNVAVGKDASLRLSNYNNWTISLWVKPDNNFTSRKYPLMYTYGDYRSSVGLAKANGRIESWRNDSSTIYSNTSLSTGDWHHVVVVRSSANTLFYLNGVADGSSSSVTINDDNKGSFIGGYPGYRDGDLRGVIDEVRVSNVRRSADWIKQSYQMVQNQNTHVSTGTEIAQVVGPTLTGSLNVDNTFIAYISTDDSVQGTFLGSGNDWPTTVDIASSLVTGQDFYLHIYATDVGGVAGFLGEFALTGGDHTFSNGLTTLNTNASNWSVSTTGWSSYEAARAYGANGVSPWGAIGGVDSAAEWIWSADSSGDNVNYFSTKISAPSARIDDVTVTASNNADFTVTLEQAAASDIVVSYSTSDNTAADGLDYTAATGSITIPIGQTTGTISILTLNGNQAGDVQFQLDISASDANITDASGAGTITPSVCVAGTTLNAVGIKIGGGGSDLLINTTTEALEIHAAWLAAGSPASGLIDSNTYNIAASGLSTVDRIDFGGSGHDFAGTLPYPGNGAGVNGSDFLVHTSGTLSLAAGDYTLFVESDDGFSLEMNTLSGDTVSFNKFGGSTAGGTNELRYENPTGNSNTGGSFTLSQDSIFDIAAIFFERGGGDYLEVSIVNDIRTSYAPSGYEILRHGAIGDKVQLGQCVVPAVTPVLDYRFDEESWNGTAGELIDNSDSLLHGQSSGGTLSQGAQVCRGATFDGVDDYFILPPISTDFSAGLSAMAWVDFNSAQYWERIFDFSNGQANNNILFARNGTSNDLTFEIYNGGSSCGKTTASNGIQSGRHHYAATLSPAGAVVLYRDGVAIESGTSSCQPANVTRSTNYIGRSAWASDGYFDSQIDELKVFDSGLSASNISDIYDEEFAGNNYDGSTRTCPVTVCDTSTLSAVGIKIDGGGSNSQINNTTEALAIHAAWLAAGSPASGLIDSNTYNIAASGLSTVDRIDFGGSGHDFSGTLLYPGAGAGVSGSDFLVHTSGTLSLPAGDYTLFVESDDGFSFIMNMLSGDTVSFNKFGSSSSGASNELRYENTTGNSNTGGSFTLTQDSVFDIAAIFFERGGGDYLEISIANDIRTNSAPTGYEILRHGALSGQVKFGQCVSTSGPDHYAISHTTQGLTCEGSQITVTAHDASHNPFVVSSDTAITVSTTPTVTSIIPTTVSIPSGSSSTTFFLNQTSALSNIDINVSDGSATDLGDGGSEDPSIDFLDTALRFYTNGSSTTNIGTQIAGKASNVAPGAQSLTLRAVRTNTDTGACEAALQGTSAVNFAYECNNPTSCTANNLVTLTGANTATIARNNNATVSKTYAPVNMTFDANGEAPFSINFADAGQITLHAEKTVAVNSPEPAFTLSGSSNAFVTRPFGFNLDFNDASAFAVDHNGSAFKAAGSDFTMQVTAVNWQAGDDADNDGVPDSGADLAVGNATAFNFGQETSASALAIAHSLVLPSAATGDSGTFSATTLTVGGGGSFTSGTAATTLNWDEVGIIDIEASFNNYLAEPGTDIATTAANVGRFHPASFDLAIADASFAPVCNSVFTYLDQSFQFDTEPSVTIQALNALGGVTQNYEGDFWKLGATLQEQSSCSAIGTTKGFCYTDNVAGLASFSRPNSAQSYGADLSNVNGEVTLALHNQSFDLFQYERPVGTNITPFDADVQLTIELNDSDNVTGAQTLVNIGFSGDLDIGSKNATNAAFLRHGRWRMENAYGPETDDLLLTAHAQYFAVSNLFELNADDSCTAFSTANIALSPSGAGASAFDDIAVGSGTSDFSLNSPLVAGASQNFSFSAPLAGNADTIDIGVDLSAFPWLRFDWNGDGSLDDHPNVSATFGQYRGHDRIIYWRELSN
jgi:MSHA biogenesis protein MshQ